MGEGTRRPRKMGKREEDEVKRKNDEFRQSRKDNDKVQTLWIRRGSREGGPKTFVQRTKRL